MAKFKIVEKRILSFVGSILMLMFFTMQTPFARAETAEFSGSGDGSIESPYIITTAEQLNEIRDNPDANYKLGCDIDLSTYLSNGNAGYNDGKGWESIQEFSGSLNGNNFTVSGLWINIPEEEYYVGLISANVGSITNLGISIGEKGITGNSVYVGGLVGYNSIGNIEHCYVVGTVKGEEGVGGLVGYNSGNISQCFSSGNVLANNAVGGIAGYNDGDLISECYSISSIRGKNMVGGLVGRNENENGNILRCYAAGTVIGEEMVGGLIGDQSANAEQCFFDTETTNQLNGTGQGEISLGITGKTTEEMKTKSNFADWDFDNIWDIKDGNAYPYLRSSIPACFSFSPKSTPYNGSQQAVTVTRNSIGEAVEVGDATNIRYNNSSDVPVNRDSYDIMIDMSESERTNPKEGISIGTFVIELAKLNASDFSYDLSPVVYDGNPKPVTISGNENSPLKDAINKIIEEQEQEQGEQGYKSIKVQYKLNGTSDQEWSEDPPVNKGIYNVQIYIEETPNFEFGQTIPLGDYVIGIGHNIIYKNYDGSDIENLNNSMPTKYVEGTELKLPTIAPSNDMEGWTFLGFWSLPLDNSEDKKINIPGPGYENEKALDFTIGNKIETISTDSTTDITLYARYTSDLFDKDVNVRENYIFAAPGVFPNGSTASMRLLESNTEEYQKTLEEVEEKDQKNIKIVEFEVHDKNGNKVQPKTFFGDAIIGFKIPDGFNADDISLVRIVSNDKDIVLRSKIWVDPSDSNLKYIEGVTDHFSPYAILSPWYEGFLSTGDQTLIWIISLSLILIISVGVIIWINRKKITENFKK